MMSEKTITAIVDKAFKQVVKQEAADNMYTIEREALNTGGIWSDLIYIYSRSLRPWIHASPGKRMMYRFLLLMVLMAMSLYTLDYLYQLMPELPKYTVPQITWTGYLYGKYTELSYYFEKSNGARVEPSIADKILIDTSIHNALWILNGLQNIVIYISTSLLFLASILAAIVYMLRQRMQIYYTRLYEQATFYLYMIYQYIREYVQDNLHHGTTLAILILLFFMVRIVNMIYAVIIAVTVHNTIADLRKGKWYTSISLA
jgi:hypothetical protein